MRGPQQSIGILGGGAWGTALGNAFAHNGYKVTIWSIEQDVVEAINRHQIHPHFKDVALSPLIRATGALSDLEPCTFLLNVVSAQAVRRVSALVAEVLSPKLIILCSKGIEQKTNLLMSDVSREVLPQFPVAVLSGPTFADDVIRGHPVSFDLACSDEKLGLEITDAISYEGFRGTYTNDVLGVQLGGSLKNVMAIAAGMAIGLQLGDSFRATFLTKALEEMGKLGQTMGAKKETFYGLSGLGDLTLTCNGPQSRNLSLGIDLGKGLTLPQAIANRGGAVAEGVYTCESAKHLALKYRVKTPLIDLVDRVLNLGTPPKDAFHDLV